MIPFDDDDEWTVLDADWLENQIQECVRRGERLRLYNRRIRLSRAVWIPLWLDFSVWDCEITYEQPSPAYWS